MRRESSVQMKRELNNGILNSIFGGLGVGGLPALPFFVLKVRREQLIEDTLNGLIKEGVNLKQPLKVL